MYIILAILLFGFLIFIHELGHFIAARACKVKVNEFSIGMGPKLVSKTSKKNGIVYSLRVLPIGGFVSMDGENEASQNDDALCNRPVWQRIIITVAGPLMNLVLGFLLMIVLVSATGGPLATNTIDSFQDISISNLSGLKAGDTVIKVDGTRVHTGNELVYEIMMQGYEPIDLIVERNGQKIFLPDVVFPVETQSGMEIGVYDFYLKGESMSFGRLLKHSWFRSMSTVKMVWDSLIGLVSGRFGVEAVSGPVGVTEQITDVAKTGDSLNLLYLFIVISINLGVMNLLPLPALDGGHLFFYILELFNGKPVVNREIENYIHAIGLIVLLGFIGIISIKDIIGIFK